MIREAIQHVQDHCEKTLRPDLVHIPGDHPDVYYCSTKDGLQRVTRDPMPRRLEFSLVEDFVSFAAALSTDDSFDPAVYCDFSTACLVFDVSDGLEYASLLLNPSREYLFFENLDTHCSECSVSSFRSALLYTLCDCYEDPDLLKQVSALSASRSDSDAVSLSRDKESLSGAVGHSVLAQNLPPSPQVFNVRPWSNPDLTFRYPISFALDPNVKSLSWVVSPLPCQIETFVGRSVDTLWKLVSTALEKTGIPVYRGRYCRLCRDS